MAENQEIVVTFTAQTTAILQSRRPSARTGCGPSARGPSERRHPDVHATDFAYVTFGDSYGAVEIDKTSNARHAAVPGRHLHLHECREQPRRIRDHAHRRVAPRSHPERSELCGGQRVGELRARGPVKRARPVRTATTSPVTTAPSNWSAAWVETDNGGGGATNGFIRVPGNVLQFRTSTAQAPHATGELRVPGSQSHGRLSPVLTFSFALAAFPNNQLAAADTVAVQASADGVAFTTLATFSGATAPGNYSYNLAAYVSATTTIRLIITGGFPNANSTHRANFDNVDITWGALSTFASGNPPEFLSSSHWVSHPARRHACHAHLQRHGRRPACRAG